MTDMGRGSPTLSWRRIGGIAGIVFGLGGAAVLAGMLGSAPTFEDPVSEMRDYFSNDASTYFVYGWIIALLFVVGFLVFASALRSLLAASDDDAGVWARVSFAGAVVAVAIAGGASAFWSALAIDGTDAYSDSTIQALMNLDAMAYGSALPWAFLVFLLGASVVILRTGVVWRWLGWLGLVIALDLLIGAWWVADGDTDGFLAVMGFIGFFATLLWSVLTGIAMLRETSTA